jgi:hypothetical protein
MAAIMYALFVMEEMPAPNALCTVRENEMCWVFHRRSSQMTVLSYPDIPESIPDIPDQILITTLV